MKACSGACAHARIEWDGYRCGARVGSICFIDFWRRTCGERWTQVVENRIRRMVEIKPMKNHPGKRDSCSFCVYECLPCRRHAIENLRGSPDQVWKTFRLLTFGLDPSLSHLDEKSAPLYRVASVQVGRITGYLDE